MVIEATGISTESIQERIKSFNLLEILRGGGEAPLEDLTLVIEAAGRLANERKERKVITPNDLMPFVILFGGSAVREYTKEISPVETPLRPEQVKALLKNCEGGDVELEESVKLVLVAAREMQDSDPLQKRKPLTLETLFVFLFPTCNRLLMMRHFSFTTQLYCWLHRIGPYEGMPEPASTGLFDSWFLEGKLKKPQTSENKPWAKPRFELFREADFEASDPAFEAALEAHDAKLTQHGLSLLDPFAFFKLEQIEAKKAQSIA